MTNILGPYYAPHHHWQHDRDYVRALDPAWVRIHQPDALAIHEMTECAPNARIMLRSWDIDDHNGDRKREMYADPKGAARKHLDMWRAKHDEIVAELHRNNWSVDDSRWYYGLVNEPDPAYVPQIVEYTAEAMRLVKGTLIRLGVVCSSVGTFSKPSENGDGWTKFIPLEKPINDGGHILIVHEYWQPEGPNYGEDAGNLAWRHHSIPLNVPILIGESGANGYIYGRHSQQDDAGWRKFMSPEQFAAQVKEYILGCDQRVKGVLLYMLDYHSKQWESFYTGPAAQQLLAIKDARPSVANPFAASTPPVTVHLPSIGNGPSVPQPTYPPFDPMHDENWFADPKRGYVTADNVNVRLGPGLDYPVVDSMQSGEPVVADVEVERTGYNWVRVEAEGWVADKFVQWQGAATPPQPQGDNWSRAYPEVLRFEGGLSLDPNDSGNWYQGKLVGTKYGISAAGWGGQYDIPNLTKEQALEIYRKHYWEASGADKLPWPMCLIVFDTAINHGVGVAQKLLNYKPTPEEIYLGQRGLRYFDDPKWANFGIAWGRRVNNLHGIAEASA